jgi:hypothetical protein
MICICVWLVANNLRLTAQRVMYCTPVNDRFSIRWELAGRSGDYYWILTTTRKRVIGRPGSEMPVLEELHFDIYNSRMIQVHSVPSFPITDSTIKKYFIGGDRFFDELVLLSGHKKTTLVVQRYQSDGILGSERKLVGELPFNEPGNSFLLIRSEDRSRILLLGFESVEGSAPRLHSMLFDKNWRVIYSGLYKDPSISQPFIQDDFAGYPLEDYDKGPVRLANNGQWLMASPSRINQNFLLWHFCDTGCAPLAREIGLTPSSTMEDVDLSLDNANGDVVAGILSTMNYEVIKDVRVAHYSMVGKKIDFDSSYRLNTLVSGRVHNENMVKENFVAVPGKGFILMKEYGRPYMEWNDDMGSNNYWDPTYILTDNSIPEKGIVNPAVHDGYARYGILGALGGTHGRGDLGLFYFPAGREDSCWSGIFHKEQTTELSAQNLSYMMVPVRDKLVFLYNSYLRNMDSYTSASATVLTPRGEVVADEGVLFWQFKMPLDFQQSRQISPNEVVVPYGEFHRKGFALIRF